ncbi:hypothetical protein EON63_24115, partial [archaeon]
MPVASCLLPAPYTGIATSVSENTLYLTTPYIIHHNRAPSTLHHTSYTIPLYLNDLLLRTLALGLELFQVIVLGQRATGGCMG